MTGNKTKISASVLAASMAILIPWLCRDEGTSLTAYEDVAGIWTVCSGHAYVKPGTVMTSDQCTAMTKTDGGKFLLGVANLIDADKLMALPHPNKTLSAYAHFAYNIGLGGFAGSKVLDFEKTGDFPASCEAMMNWYTAGGKDCNIRENNCYGLITRREGERDYCLEGLK